MRTRLLASLLLCAAVGCKAKIPEPEPPPAQPVVTAPQQPTAPTAPTAPTPSTPPTPSPAQEAPKPRDGWREVAARNTLPLCVFANESERAKVQGVAQVKKQLLGPDRSVTFGVFAPRCINPECDELTTLQCSVERSGNILRLQTSYTGLHKDGSTCRDGCREATAGCESPVLEPGAYSLEYGGTTVPLKIPSALNLPCFKGR